MLNMGLRTGELLGLLNSDIDLEHKTLTVRRGVKEIHNRNDAEETGRRSIKVGKPKSAISNRTIPLNQAAIEAVEDLRFTQGILLRRRYTPCMRSQWELYEACKPLQAVLQNIESHRDRA